MHEYQHTPYIPVKQQGCITIKIRIQSSYYIIIILHSTTIIKEEILKKGGQVGFCRQWRWGWGWGWTEIATHIAYSITFLIEGAVGKEEKTKDN